MVNTESIQSYTMSSFQTTQETAVCVCVFVPLAGISPLSDIPAIVN